MYIPIKGFCKHQHTHKRVLAKVAGYDLHPQDPDHDVSPHTGCPLGKHDAIID